MGDSHGSNERAGCSCDTGGSKCNLLNCPLNVQQSCTLHRIDNAQQIIISTTAASVTHCIARKCSRYRRSGRTLPLLPPMEQEREERMRRNQQMLQQLEVGVM